MLIDDFNHTLEIWINELEKINFIQLCTKPSPASWSLGQVYMHLIEATDYFMDQVNICLSSADHTTEEMTQDGKLMFHRNDFPDELIEGPPSNAATPQPESKEALMRSLLNLKVKINNASRLLSANSNTGKTKHPGLNYFSADEWFQFAEMHFRHHLRQKKRIEESLKIKSDAD